MKSKIFIQLRRCWILPFIVVLLTSCKNSESNNATLDEVKNVLQEDAKTTKSLKNKIPLNKQELVDTFPFRIGNYERDFLNVSEDMATAQGTFGEGKIKMIITDGAGPMASALTMFNALYNQKETQDNLSQKKTVRNNQNTIEHYYSDNGQASIEFIYINRFHIFLEAKVMTPDELWQVFEFDNYISSLQVLDDFDNKNIDRNH